jgi:anthranilate synthase component 1
MKNLPKIQIGQKPIYKKIADDVDFFELFKKIDNEFATCFLFESLGEEAKFSRYSIIGFEPDYIISARENILVVDNKKYRVTNPYKSLREIMPKTTITREYSGGLVGYLSYEAVNYFETSVQVKIHDTFDQFCFGVYTDGLIYDKLTSDLHYFYYDKNRLPIIKDILKKKTFQQKKLNVTFIKNTSSKKEHAEQVKKVKRKIIEGKTFQCEVGFKSEYRITGDTIQIYERLRKVNPSPFMYYLKFNDKKIIGASPELLFSLRDGEMTTKPLAGTIKRGKTVKEDQLFAKKLLSDPKEIAEHNMLVDLHRNDIGGVAQFGTVKIKELMGIKKFSHVQHISSEIVGLIKKEEDMFSGLASNFPTGTLTGAPKIESMKIINFQEKLPRGPYGGGVGHFGFNGDCTFAIAIRSLFISGTHGYIQASGGIVADSVAEKEYEEIQNKLAAMKRILDANNNELGAN